MSQEEDTVTHETEVSASLIIMRLSHLDDPGSKLSNAVSDSVARPLSNCKVNNKLLRALFTFIITEEKCFINNTLLWTTLDHLSSGPAK